MHGCNGEWGVGSAALNLSPRAAAKTSELQFQHPRADFIRASSCKAELRIKIASPKRPLLFAMVAWRCIALTWFDALLIRRIRNSRTRRCPYFKLITAVMKRRMKGNMTERRDKFRRADLRKMGR